MGKLRVLSGRDVCKIMAEFGFKEVRQKGSHILMQKKVERTIITVPIRNHEEPRMGTLLGII